MLVSFDESVALPPQAPDVVCLVRAASGEGHKYKEFTRRCGSGGTGRGDRDWGRHCGLLPCGGPVGPASGAVLERKLSPYHASGRSAAIYIEPHSSDPIFALTLGTLPFLLNPPEALPPLLTPRGHLLLAPKGPRRRGCDLENWAHRCTDLEEISLEEPTVCCPCCVWAMLAERCMTAMRWPWTPTG